MKIKIMGIGLLIILIAMVLVILFAGRKPSEDANITGYVGGEKIGLLEDPQVQEIFKKRYGLNISYKKMGSLDMAKADTSEVDYIFPSNSFAAELYQANGGKSHMTTDAFISPIVIYSWDKVVDALVAQGVASKMTDTAYSLDMEKLIQMVINGTTWEEIGVSDLYGQICVYSTDPVRSNSGNLMAVLAATVLNGNKVVTENDVPNLIDPVTTFLSRSGYKESSSADLFQQYLRTGMGGKTLVALYENQMIEFAAQNPQDWEGIKDKVRILYPTPTVLSNHPFIAMNENSAGFFKAIEDEEISKLAWQNHGFRMGTTGISQVSEEMRQMGVAEEVTRLIPMPEYPVMEKMLEGLSATWR